MVFADLQAGLDTKLQRLLNTCVRFVSGVPRDIHITPYRRELGWLRAKDRRLYFLLSQLFTILRSGRPAYLRELFVLAAPGRDLAAQRPSRAFRSDFVVPCCRTNAYLNSFAVAGTHHWDSLPPALKTAPTLASFKHGLFEHLLNTEDARS